LGAVAEKKCGGCNGCSLAGSAAPPSPPPAPHRILRRASPVDTAQAERLHEEEEPVRRKVMERVQQHALPMKVSDAEWQWDRKKLTIYFTAEQSVELRALVRDIAGLIHTRIEQRHSDEREED